MKSTNFEFEYPRILSIAGSDSGGGAGIQADLKTFSALGCFGMTAITAITAQNTIGVSSIHSVPPEMLQYQIDAVMEDIGADALKVGMLNVPETVMTVANSIDKYLIKLVVFDPVMVATSGAVLIDEKAIDVLVQEMFPRSTVITPNLDEASLLVGKPLKSKKDMKAAAIKLCQMGAKSVLVKGGHLEGDIVFDLLLDSSGHEHWFEGVRIQSPNTHGTGCTLSSAIAAHLATGQTLIDSVSMARIFVREALSTGAFVKTGEGSGPLNHFHSPMKMHLKRLH